ncbi:MAG: GNAT family N-acetyltransferase [Dehalococcoidales bacterium]|nr:GNAT family N-acetyltransferase [Dehalococcoidales bacterium]
MNIKYVEKDKSQLDIVHPLWEKIKEHHRARSIHFKEQFDATTWEIRKKQILDKADGGALLVHLAMNNDTGNFIGYCVTSIDGDNVGEIESIFIEADYRRVGIGNAFMQRALEWMKSYGVKRKVIAVAAGNEEVFGFYAKYNFYPRISVLMQPEEKS